MAPRRSATCPFLVPTAVDHLWLYPTGAYCHPPGRRVRVPARSTLARMCLTRAYMHCAGYRDGLGAEAGLFGHRAVEAPGIDQC